MILWHYDAISLAVDDAAVAVVAAGVAAAVVVAGASRSVTS